MSKELQRLRRVYADWDSRLVESNVYSPFNPAYLFMVQQRQRETLKLLRREGCMSLADKTVLEIGCGSGKILHEYQSYGVSVTSLHGVDLLWRRVKDAQNKFRNIFAIQADAQHLPYASCTFDLALQYTVFSSILDDEVKQNLAAELLRVVRPGGLILWYDFWLNPTNPHTRGIRPPEIRRLFPGCRFVFKRVTLAPPITRRLVRVSWLLCALLEKIRIFNSHYLVAIRACE